MVMELTSLTYTHTQTYALQVTRTHIQNKSYLLRCKFLNTWQQRDSLAIIQSTLTVKYFGAQVQLQLDVH